MRHITLVVKECSVTGELGFVPTGITMGENYVAATEGLLIAHDILEHQNGLKSIGSVDDELEALGGIWFVRGMTGQLRRDGRGSMHSLETSIGSDVCELGRVHNYGVAFRNPVPRTRKSEIEDELQETLKEGLRMLTVELEGEDMDWQAYHEFKAAAIHYLRRGYSKAKKRFGSTWTANSIFWNIAEAVGNVANWIEFEGQTFRLSYDSRNAYCQEIFEEQY